MPFYLLCIFAVLPLGSFGVCLACWACQNIRLLANVYVAMTSKMGNNDRLACAQWSVLLSRVCHVAAMAFQGEASWATLLAVVNGWRCIAKVCTQCANS